MRRSKYFKNHLLEEETLEAETGQIRQMVPTLSRSYPSEFRQVWTEMRIATKTIGAVVR